MLFWILIGLMVLLALLLLLPVLFRKNKLDSSQDTGGKNPGEREQNIKIAKEQLLELEARFEKGDVDETTYQASRDEIELALLNHIDQLDASDIQSAGRSSMLSGIMVALFVPLLSLALYFSIGNRDFIDPATMKAAQPKNPHVNPNAQKDIPRTADGRPDVPAMVAILEKRMNSEREQGIKNAEGWFMLGRSQMIISRFKDAVASFEEANKQQPNTTQVQLALADALSMSNHGVLKGRPAELIEQVLKREPDNAVALWLSGMSYRQQDKFEKAITQWQQARPQIKDKTQLAQLEERISEAISQLPEAQQAQYKTSEVASSSAQDTVASGITVSVKLSQAFQDKAKPEDMVFIYAKAVSGPPMPLAAVKKQVKDLPVQVTLDDSKAMLPAMKLSDFTEVIIGARVSFSGQPIAQNGDLFAEKQPIQAGQSVMLEINDMVKK